MQTLFVVALGLLAFQMVLAEEKVRQGAAAPSFLMQQQQGRQQPQQNFQQQGRQQPRQPPQGRQQPPQQQNWQQFSQQNFQQQGRQQPPQQQNFNNWQNGYPNNPRQQPPQQQQQQGYLRPDGRYDSSAISSEETGISRHRRPYGSTPYPYEDITITLPPRFAQPIGRNAVTPMRRQPQQQQGYRGPY